MKATLILLLFYTANLTVCDAQPPLAWQKSLGGSNTEVCVSIKQTLDGGYISCGILNSNNGDVTGNHLYLGNTTFDFWVVKTNALGGIEWQRSLGGSGDDYGLAIQQTLDGGYIAGGYSTSADGDVTGNKGGEDCWIAKLSGTGAIEWQKNYGGSNDDQLASLQQTADGGYIVSAWSKSNDGDVTGRHNGWDYWIVKLENYGNIQWQKCLGGSADDVFPLLAQTADGGYIVCGSSSSNDGDVVGQHSGGSVDYWVVKLSNGGAIQWQKCLGGTKLDNAYAIKQTVDGGYVVAGYSLSNDGDVSGHQGTTTTSDYWVVKLNSVGGIEWQKSLGGTADDVAHSVTQTADGGYLIAGYSGSNDGNAPANLGQDDYWLVKLDSVGSMKWQRKYGGSGTEWPYSIESTNDGGYLIAGYSDSNNGHVSGNKGGEDYWLLKLSEDCTGASIVYWLGSINTNWNNPANWRCGIVPDESTHVIIPSGVIRYPVLTANANVKTITLQTNATLQVNTGVLLTVKGTANN